MEESTYRAAIKKLHATSWKRKDTGDIFSFEEIKPGSRYHINGEEAELDYISDELARFSTGPFHGSILQMLSSSTMVIVQQINGTSVTLTKSQKKD